uniref:Protein kinase domain-containing protein n=1 Tax=Eutreptiella gymnastica TaxID=73025 RepID=A0A7S1I985_9EUGL|mmetsp:Transcript_140085/g.243970  ORF Transcript_140085/g.243970 Transcript_140085/m.243970 type:complete len:315 (+) Transcript_140085:68-1012(+)
MAPPDKDDPHSMSLGSIKSHSSSLSSNRVKHKYVGDYKLGHELGSGTFAKVVEGTHKDTQQRVAVKIISKSKILGQTLEKVVRREVDIMLKLKHPNIVRLFEVVQSSNNIYMIMELVIGGDLFELVNTARKTTNTGIPEDKSRNLFQQLICGLHVCHLQGIAHRDLKPENLLVSSDGCLKIADFGLANIQKTNEYLRTVCGTISFVAPEVLIEGSYDGFKSDIWSAGNVLFTMLSAQFAFPHPKQTEVVEAIKAVRYTMPPSIQPNAADLIRHILVRDPDQRYTIADVVQHPWFNVEGWDSTRLQAASAEPQPG